MYTYIGSGYKVKVKCMFNVSAKQKLAWNRKIHCSANKVKRSIGED